MEYVGNMMVRKLDVCAISRAYLYKKRETDVPSLLIDTEMFANKLALSIYIHLTSVRSGASVTSEISEHLAESCSTKHGICTTVCYPLYDVSRNKLPLTSRLHQQVKLHWAITLDIVAEWSLGKAKPFDFFFSFAFLSSLW